MESPLWAPATTELPEELLLSQRLKCKSLT